MSKKDALGDRYIALEQEVCSADTTSILLCQYLYIFMNLNVSAGGKVKGTVAKGERIEKST